ncbi:MAG: NUDIX hydrolase [Clostridia bacterium]|nr:NUDIX hydrolase [Clostridia bacterium]
MYAMHEEELREEFLSGEEVFRGKLINVEHWRVRLPDGQQAWREVVKHCGAVAVVPLDDAGNVTLVQQHRIAVGRFTWEIPAGKLDHGSEEGLLLAAQRELEEETGLRAENWELLTDIDTTPGFCNEHIAIFLATGLSQHEMHTDEDEFLHAAAIPLHEAVQRVMAGEIRDSKTIAGILMAHMKQQHQSAAPFDALSPIQRVKGTFASRGK